MRNYRIRRAAKRVCHAGLPVPLKGSRSCRGQSLVEFAVVAMTFFLMCFALIDFSWLLFSQMNMQDAVHQAGRFASTGQAGSITQIIQSYAEGTNIESVSVTTGANPGVGGPGDTVTIKVYCDVPLLTTALGNIFGTSDNKFHFTVSTTYKNEPFSSSQTTQ